MTKTEGQTQSMDPPNEPDDAAEPIRQPGMNWYVLRVASNKENYVRETLLVAEKMSHV